MLLYISGGFLYWANINFPKRLRAKYSKSLVGMSRFCCKKFIETVLSTMDFSLVTEGPVLTKRKPQKQHRIQFPHFGEKNFFKGFFVSACLVQLCAL